MISIHNGINGLRRKGLPQASSHDVRFPCYECTLNKWYVRGYDGFIWDVNLPQVHHKLAPLCVYPVAPLNIAIRIMSIDKTKDHTKTAFFHYEIE